jgi:GNAT superfamily N-acetyltransferase
MSDVAIRREPIRSPTAAALIAALNAELTERYPEPGANHFRLEEDEVAPGRGAFFVAWAGAEAIGCGAFRKIDPACAEVKRMYVVPAWRGRGVARSVLAALEQEARSLGATRLLLETGARQPESLALYRSAGFVEVPAYGEYVGSTWSICLGKDL